ncbi:Alpha/Beta hydrolase protein [Syncephalis plumigaleata]|nr:Alpha/Beta hydrolase protein [Syncephalis plumigaleata]
MQSIHHAGYKAIRYSISVHGKGTRRVILIAGRGAKGDGWMAQAVFLARCGFQVCVFDNRGIGKSGRPDTPFTTYDMALDTIELLNHLGWKSDIHLVGMSMGGMISQHLLLHYPQYFISCCLTSTSANMKKPNSNTIPTQSTSLPERIIEVSSMFPEVRNTLMSIYKYVE